MEPDLQSLEASGAGTLERLNNVVAWLHQEGFYAAESALLAEVENRFPDHSTDAGIRSPERASLDDAGFSMSPRVVELMLPTMHREGSAEDSLNSAERCVLLLVLPRLVPLHPPCTIPSPCPLSPLPPLQPNLFRVLEAWRSKSTTPVASPRKSTSPPAASLQPVAGSGSTSWLPCDREEVDEYDDDEDVGYWRIPLSQGEGTSRLGPFHSGAPMPTVDHGPLASDRSHHHPSGLPKSPSTTSLGYSAPHSRHGSLEVPPLQLEAPVVGGTQYVPQHRSSSRLPPPSPYCSQPSPRPGTEDTPRSGQVRYQSPGSSDAGGYIDAGGGWGVSADRRAGTAQWVFDRKNSAGSEAFKSLLSFLDQQSPRTQPLHLSSTDPSDVDACCIPAPSPRSDDQMQHGLQSSRRQPSQQQQDKQQQASVPDVDTGGALKVEPSATQLSNSGGGLTKNRDSQVSLTEAVVREAVEEVLAELQIEDMGVEDCGDAKEGSPDLADTSTISDREEREGHDSTTGTADAVRASSSERGPGGDADKGSNPFSFPVTSSSEPPEPVAPAPMFGIGSWPSFKNLSSPQRSIGLPGYCSADDDGAGTPVSGREGSGRRRGHRPRLSTASSGNLVGLQPPAPRLSQKFPHHMRHSSSQSGGLAQYSGGIPRSPGQYDDVALYDYDEDAVEARYEFLDLRIIHRRQATGFEQTRELPLRINDLIAGRYQIVELLGQAAFSRAVQALDLKTGALVCLKVVKNNKDFFDQSLDEIKILRYVNAADPGDEHGILRLYDYFYFREHLILVTELLRANLYEFSKHDRESGEAPYFTPVRVQSMARQILRSLAFLHSLGLVHADLKPENILMKSYSACEVKVIDLGSSCFLTDRLSSYVQSRSYRAPEVILGLQYNQKIDIWSLGCILAEMVTGRVLFPNSTPATILARMEGILGKMPGHMVVRGKYAPRYFTADSRIYQRNSQTVRLLHVLHQEGALHILGANTSPVVGEIDSLCLLVQGQIELLKPKRSSLARRVREADEGMLDFLSMLLQVDPGKRPTASDALHHPWLDYRY